MTLLPARKTQALSSGGPERIDVIVVACGHHLDCEPSIGLYTACDHIQLGHDEALFACPEDRNLLVRGIRRTVRTADTATNAAVSAPGVSLTARPGRLKEQLR